MSKLLEKLEQLVRGRPQPLGFATAAARQEKPRPLILIASLAVTGVNKSALALQEKADALLFTLTSFEKEKEGLLEALREIASLPWGIRASALDAQEIAALKEWGCDFLVFGYEATSAAVFHQEELGKFLEASPTWPEGLLRALSNLPLDGLFLAEELPFTVQGLLTLERLARFADRPLMVTPSATATTADLELLWNSGVKGLVVSLEASDAQERLDHLRQAVEKMEAEPRRGREKVDALLPRPTPEPLGTAEEEEEEEEDL